MILVDNYFLAILCCVICCACWGSWANTQKMVAAKQWSFELFLLGFDRRSVPYSFIGGR